MAWNAILSLIYGFISGFTGLLPVSDESHQILFLQLTGVTGNSAGFRLACHTALLVALIVFFRPQLLRFRRERKLAAVPARRRRRQPDTLALKEDRFWRTGMIPACLITILLGLLRRYIQGLWLLAILLFVSGMLLYLPQFYRRGNKAAETVSGLDAVLLGASCGLSSVPGLSGFAGGLFTGSLRGMDSRFAADNSMMMLLSVVPVLIAFDVYEIIVQAQTLFTAGWIVLYFLAALAAFGGACLAVKLVRFLAVRVGFSGFAFYCWGLSVFTFAVYLIV